MTATRTGGEPAPPLTVSTADGPASQSVTVVERAEFVADVAPDAAPGLVVRLWLSRWPTNGVSFRTADSVTPDVL
ncbi:hypothetical protein ACI3PL_28290, partial [Lacticaseibacillus paracasei]